MPRKGGTADAEKLKVPAGGGDLNIFSDLGNMVFLGVTGEEERQGTVAGDVAGGAEAVLQGKDRKHQRRAGIVEAQHADDEAKRGHDRAARNTGGPDGEDRQ